MGCKPFVSSNEILLIKINNKNFLSMDSYSVAGAILGLQDIEDLIEKLKSMDEDNLIEAVHLITKDGSINISETVARHRLCDMESFDMEDIHDPYILSYVDIKDEIVEAERREAIEAKQYEDYPEDISIIGK